MEATVGRPPEFGLGGSWPPIRSKEMEVSRWSVDDTSGWLGRVETSMEELYTVHQTLVLENEELVSFELFYNVYCTWVEEIVCYHFWVRDDPPLQLAPGTSAEYGMARRVGLSIERAREVSKNLGLTGKLQIPGFPVELSSQLSTKTSMKLGITEEETWTQKITVTNPQVDRYRCIARWYLYCRFSRVAAPRLSARGKQVYSSVSELDFDTAERVLFSVEYLVSDAIVMTSIDLPM